MNTIKSIWSIFNTPFSQKGKRFWELQFGKKIIFKVWEKPGLWMNNDDLALIINDLQKIVSKAQPSDKPITYGVLQGDIEDLKRRVLTIVYDKNTGEAIGFSAQIFFDTEVNFRSKDCLHLGLACVSSHYKGKSLLGYLYFLPNILMLFKRKLKPIWISNVSQVPAVIGVVAEYYDEVFPNPIYFTEQTSIHQQIATQLMQRNRSVFGTGQDAILHLRQQIITNSYTGGSDDLKKTYEACPKFRKDEVNVFCQQHLNYQRGDDFLQIGILSENLIFKFLEKKIEYGSWYLKPLFVSVWLYMLLGISTLKMIFFFNVLKSNFNIMYWKVKSYLWQQTISLIS